MRAVQIGIGLLLAFAVLAHGAVETWSESIFEIGSAALLLFWALLVMRKGELELTWSWLYLPLGGLCLFALLQLALGFSLYAYATKLELLRWAACLLLFFLVIQSFQNIRQVTAFSWFLLTLCFLVSLFAIVQQFTFNGKLYWIRELHEGGMPFGPFVDRNHFAGFVELVAPLGLAMLFQNSIRRDKIPLLALLIILPIGALLLSGSLGGFLSFAFELVFLALLVGIHRLGKWPLALVTGVLLAVAFLVVWLGASGVFHRFAQRSQMDYGRRMIIVKDTWRIFLHHPWIGTGLGTFQAVYPRYETYYDGYTVNHAHNDYVELLSDTGVVGGICGSALIGLVFVLGLAQVRAAQSRVGRAVHVGSLVACAGLLVHGLVDFNLHIPSNASLFFLLAAIATSSFPEPESRHGRPNRTAANFNRR